MSHQYRRGRRQRRGTCHHSVVVDLPQQNPEACESAASSPSPSLPPSISERTLPFVRPSSKLSSGIEAIAWNRDDCFLLIPKSARESSDTMSLDLVSPPPRPGKCASANIAPSNRSARNFASAAASIAPALRSRKISWPSSKPKRITHADTFRGHPFDCIAMRHTFFRPCLRPPRLGRLFGFWSRRGRNPLGDPGHQGGWLFFRCVPSGRAAQPLFVFPSPSAPPSPPTSPPTSPSPGVSTASCTFSPTLAAFAASLRARKPPVLVDTEGFEFPLPPAFPSAL